MRLGARWHIVTGSTGAGKSTFARELAARAGGVRLSIDEWMAALFWMDSPEKKDFSWAMDRIGRCEAQIASVALSLAAVSVDAVLDLGFTLREHREAWLKRAREAGVAVELHVLDVPAEVRWGRVCERNGGTSETFSFEVTREMFDFMEARWELPSADELAEFSRAEE